jgi:hypothetical protein
VTLKDHEQLEANLEAAAAEEVAWCVQRGVGAREKQYNFDKLIYIYIYIAGGTRSIQPTWSVVVIHPE